MIAPSVKSSRTHNPIRKLVDQLKPPANHPKTLLNLSLGDPTAHGNLHAPPVLIDAVKSALGEDRSNGYLASVGSLAARRAIARRASTASRIVDEAEVVIASGASGALELAISALVNEGDNILVPRPGFPLYQVIADSLGAGVRHYSLRADKNWEADLDEMRSLVNDRTRAILVCNPSNPCGSNYSAEHLADIAQVARDFNLPIIADEIYSHVVFHGEFTPMHAVIPEGDVPVISIGGIAKEFIVPGWRLGWIVFFDHRDPARARLTALRQGVINLSQLILGACSLIQAALPRLLCPEPGSEDERALKEFHDHYMGVLRQNAEICREAAATCPEISVNVPEGAMYAMMGVKLDLLDGIEDDADFARQLLTEENLFVLPGKIFGMDSFVRLVVCMPQEKLLEAMGRIKEFCTRHKRA